MRFKITVLGLIAAVFGSLTPTAWAAPVETDANYCSVNISVGGPIVCSSSPSDLGSWSDRVSSFHSYGSCATRLWTGTGYTGSAYGWSVSSNVPSSLNDKARSAQFS
jgi:hypothetical protein